MRLKSIYKSVFLTTVVLFAGCSGDEYADPSGSAPQIVSVTLTASRAYDGTRTTLEDREDGGLKSLWKDGDRLLVVNADGSKTWELTLEKGAGESRGVFSGEIDDFTDGTGYRVWYLGDSNDGANPYTRVYAYENNCLESVIGSSTNYRQGLKGDLVRADLLSAELELTVGEDGLARAKETVEMISQLAMAHFTLTDLPEGIADDNNARLTVCNVAKNDLKQTTVAYYIQMNPLKWNGPREAEGFTIDNRVFGQGTDKTKAEVYLALFPGDYKLAFELSMTDGSKYNYTFSTITTVEAGRYYSATNGQTGEPSDSGISVPMKKASAYPGYENEDPNNPLHKFAKTNLIRKADGSVENIFAASETENGALYQWGRNYGYMDTNGIYREEVVSSSSDYVNFIDALGRFDDADAEYARILDYYVYNPSPNRYFMVSGTATRYTPSHPQYSLWYDSPKFYTSKQDIIDNPTKYFMDGTPKGRFLGYGNPVIGMEVENYNPDYWLSSFGDGGSNWEARAQACGYTRTNPCPDGWRLPTSEEFMEIIPEGNGIDENSPLATILSDYSELRQTKSGVRYAIRWRYTSTSDVITIECVVVDQNITSSSQLTTLFWDENVDSKVVRTFPFTGVILPLISICDTYYMANEHLVVRPHHRGFLDYTGIPSYGPSNNYYWMLIGPGDVNDGNKAFGGYWVSDKGKAFKFEAKERSNGKNTSNLDSFTQTSCMFFGDADPVMGYAIRPVMAK